jgi:hypothetical protein
MQIFPNGTMTYTDPTAKPQADLDENGLPVSASSVYNQLSVVCTISTLSENRKGRYDDGRYRNCQYSVTCNLEDVGTAFNSVKSVSLNHDIKGNLGTFQVQRIEFYTITQTVEIWL